MKPILFNTEMVRAILDGRKTCARRAIKPQPSASEEKSIDANGYLSTWDFTTAPFGIGIYKCQYQPDDVLYVRETWGTAFTYGGHGDPGKTGMYVYKADGDHLAPTISLKWHPSIHMPKEAARIFLRVTNVRPEHLQDMTCDDMLAEGVIPKKVKGGSWQQWQRDYMRPAWNSTIKPSEYSLYSWGKNPWVWVIEFESISKEEAGA